MNNIMNEKQKNTSWRNKTVLVTGAGGLVGSWLVNDLIALGAAVIVLIRDISPVSNFFLYGLDKKVIQVQGDLCDYKSLVRIINEFDINTIFHLGAQTIVGYANRSPLSTFHSNIEGTWNLLEACKNSPWVKKIIIASSDKAYGDQKILPYTEDTALAGKYPYDVSKSCADLIAQSYFHTYKLPVCITRCGNIFGPGDFHWNRIVPGTIRSLLQDESPIIRSDGSYIRDYIYVKDIVDAYILLAQKMENDAQCIGQAFNISEESPLSVLQLVMRITNIMEKSHIQPIIQNKIFGEIKDQYLSCDAFKKRCHWMPKYGFEQGIQETITWYKNYFKQDSGVEFEVLTDKVIPEKTV